MLPPFFDAADIEVVDCERGAVRIAPVRINDYIERIIPGLSDRQFQMHFRISRRAFNILLPLVDNHVKKYIVTGRPRMETN